MGKLIKNLPEQCCLECQFLLKWNRAPKTNGPEDEHVPSKPERKDIDNAPSISRYFHTQQFHLKCAQNQWKDSYPPNGSANVSDQEYDNMMQKTLCKDRTDDSCFFPWDSMIPIATARERQRTCLIEKHAKQEREENEKARKATKRAGCFMLIVTFLATVATLITSVIEIIRFCRDK